MVQLTVKLGPKGQLLIPKILREEYKLFPGKDVIMKDTPGGVLISKPQIDDPVAFFERVAKQVGKKKTYASKEYEAYLGKA